MIWVLLSVCTTLAWALHWLNEDNKLDRRLFKLDLELRQRHIDRIRSELVQAERLADTRYFALKKWRRRYRSAVKQAKIWSARALELGFSRRDYKDKVRYARQQRRAAKAASQTESPAND